MSFERIPVRILGDTYERDPVTLTERRYESDALLVSEAQAVQSLPGDECYVRLPSGIAIGERVALRRDPPADAVLEVLAEERDKADKPIYRARMARFPVKAYREAERAEQASRVESANRGVEDCTTRYYRRQAQLREQAMEALEGLEDDAFRALAALNEFEVSCLLTDIRKRAAEREPSPVG